jgi:hypothetical protein
MIVAVVIKFDEPIVLALLLSFLTVRTGELDRLLLDEEEDDDELDALDEEGSGCK